MKICLFTILCFISLLVYSQTNSQKEITNWDEFNEAYQELVNQPEYTGGVQHWEKTKQALETSENERTDFQKKLVQEYEEPNSQQQAITVNDNKASIDKKPSSKKTRDFDNLFVALGLILLAILIFFLRKKYNIGVTVYKDTKHLQANNLPQGLSFLIDCLIILLLTVFLVNLVDTKYVWWIVISIYVLYSYIEYLIGTPGKFLFSHKVLNKDLSQPPFWKILLRNFIKLPVFFFWLGLIYVIGLFPIFIMAIAGINFRKIHINNVHFFYDDLLGIAVYNTRRLKKEKELNVEESKEKHLGLDYSDTLTEEEKIKLWRFKKLNLSVINSLDSKEVIIVSIIIGAIIFLIFGYMFGEYYGKPRLLHFNFTLAISMFIISFGVSYLILNKRIKK